MVSLLGPLQSFFLQRDLWLYREVAVGVLLVVSSWGAVEDSRLIILNIAGVAAV